MFVDYHRIPYLCHHFFNFLYEESFVCIKIFAASVSNITGMCCFRQMDIYTVLSDGTCPVVRRVLDDFI